jgi:hypothetical protein
MNLDSRLTIDPSLYIGELLYFQPMYGWGWHYREPHADFVGFDFSCVHDAGVFAIRVREFFEFEGELRGIIGTVEQPRHHFHGLWVASYTMQVGEYDFQENLCARCDVEMGPCRPTLETTTREDGVLVQWPEFSIESFAYLGNGGMLGESPLALSKFMEQMDL